jgi:hypothetical protein
MSSSKSKSRPVDTRSAEQRAFEEKQFAPYLQSQFYNTATPYGEQMVADMPYDTQAEFNRAMQQMYQDNPLVREALKADMQGTPAYKYNERATAKQFEENFALPLMSSYKRNVVPILEQQYAGVPGAMLSTAKAKGVSKASEEYYSQYVQPHLYDAWQQDIQRGFQSGEAAAARRLPAASAFQSLPSAQYMQTAQMGDVSRSVEQNRLSANYEEFLRTSPENSPWLNVGLQYLAGYNPYQVGQTSKGPSFGYAAGSAAIEGFAKGVGIGVSSCDRRIKENIVPIENALARIRKLKGYTYNYIYNKPTTRDGGIMAQELEEVLPEAVVEINSIKHVKLDAIIGMLVNAVNELDDKFTRSINEQVNTKETKNEYVKK